MSEKQRQIALVVVSTKKLLLVVEKRSNAITGCCPSIVEDEQDEPARLRKVVDSQREVDEAVKEIREATKERLNGFSDAEVILLVHLWAGIWASDSALRVDSNDLDRLAGRNNPAAIGELLKGLLEGSSPVLDFLALAWNSNRGTGYYTFNVSNPNKLHRLLLGDVHIV
jgi:hypothetical protein